MLLEPGAQPIATPKPSPPVTWLKVDGVGPTAARSRVPLSCRPPKTMSWALAGTPQASVETRWPAVATE